MMKKIEAIIKSHKVEEVRRALVDAGVTGGTVGEVRGFGHQMGHDDVRHDSKDVDEFLPRIRFEIVVEEDRASGIVDAITKAANGAENGSAGITVTPILDAIRIRNGERGLKAIS